MAQSNNWSGLLMPLVLATDANCAAFNVHLFQGAQYVTKVKVACLNLLTQCFDIGMLRGTRTIETYLAFFVSGQRNKRWLSAISGVHFFALGSAVRFGLDLVGVILCELKLSCKVLM